MCVCILCHCILIDRPLNNAMCFSVYRWYRVVSRRRWYVAINSESLTYKVYSSFSCLTFSFSFSFLTLCISVIILRPYMMHIYLFSFNPRVPYKCEFYSQFYSRIFFIVYYIRDRTKMRCDRIIRKPVPQGTLWTQVAAGINQIKFLRSAFSSYNLPAASI